MKELGEYLKTHREENGVSLDEASEDLQIDKDLLESIEEGNIRAFRDVYTLKDYVRNYAKYLGLDPEKVLDEFNDFLFEHTSKISLEDIKEAQKKEESLKKKTISPYTRIPRKKFDLRPVLITLLAVLVFFFIIYLLLHRSPKNNIIDTELMGNEPWIGEVIYELT